MTILVIHHTLGVTWINIAPESIRKSYHYAQGDQRRLTPQGVRNNASSVATCSSIGAGSRLTIRCSGVARRAPWLRAAASARPGRDGGECAPPAASRSRPDTSPHQWRHQWWRRSRASRGASAIAALIGNAHQRPRRQRAILQRSVQRGERVVAVGDGDEINIHQPLPAAGNILGGGSTPSHRLPSAPRSRHPGFPALR